MNSRILAGTAFVFLALVAYSTAFFNLIKRQRVSNLVRDAYTLGVGLDLAATAFMISGSHNSPLSLHGLVGYSAFLMMAATMFWSRVFQKARGPEARISKALNWFAVSAYAWWFLAFVGGAVMGARMRH